MSEEEKVNGSAGDSTSAGDGKTVTVEEFNRYVERSRRFEGLLAEKEKALEKFKNVNPDEYFALKDSVKTSSKKSDDIDLDTKIAEESKKLEERFTGKLTELETAAEQKDRLIKELRVTNNVMSVATDFINADGLALIKPFIDQHCDWKDDKLVIKDTEGNIRYSPNNPKQEMTAEEYLEELCTKYPSIALDKRKSGTMTGANQHSSNGAYSGMTVDKFRAMTPQDRQALPADVRAKFGDLMLGVSAQSRSPFKKQNTK
jgi:hypothetical protein